MGGASPPPWLGVTWPRCRPAISRFYLRPVLVICGGFPVLSRAEQLDNLSAQQLLGRHKSHESCRLAKRIALFSGRQTQRGGAAVGLVELGPLVRRSLLAQRDRRIEPRKPRALRRRRRSLPDANSGRGCSASWSPSADIVASDARSPFPRMPWTPPDNSGSWFSTGTAP